MVKLYKFNHQKDRWEFVRFGFRPAANLYAKQGYLVVHI